MPVRAQAHTTMAVELSTTGGLVVGVTESSYARASPAAVEEAANPAADEVDDAVKTPYAVCFSALLGAEVRPSLPHSARRSARASTAACVRRVAAVALQSACMFAQVGLSFALLDGAECYLRRQMFPVYKPAVQQLNFYDPSKRTGPNPTATVLTGFIAAPVLALCLRTSITSTYTAAYPMEHVLFLARSPPTWRHLALELASLVFLQFCWVMRAMLVPGTVAFGSTLLWAAEDTAVDIVKDSVVIAYLLDFDSWGYLLLSRSMQKAHEANPGCAAPPGRRACSAVECGKWAFWLVLTWQMIDLLCGAWSLGSPDKPPFWAQLRAEKGDLHMLDVASVFWCTVHALTNGWLIWSSERHCGGVLGYLGKSCASASARKRLKAAMLLLNVATMYAMVPLNSAIFQALRDWLGYNGMRLMMPNTTLNYCVNQWGTNAYCATNGDLDTVPLPDA